MTARSAADLYHRLSSYDEERHWTEPLDDPRVRDDFIPMRPGREPVAFKDYPQDLPVVSLPTRPAPAPVAAAAVLGGALVRASGRTPELDDVSAILFQSAGVVRYLLGANGQRVYFRAASSAGNRHPVETYLCARGIDGLADGVFHYDPRRHALTLIGPAARGSAPALVVTGIPWRTSWKYAERGYRHLWWDCGTLVAQALVAGHARGLPVRVLTAFVDAQVAHLVGALPPQEVPLAVLPLADGEPAVTAAAAAAHADLGPGFESFPLVEATHAAGDLHDQSEVAQWRARHAVAACPARAGVIDRASPMSPDELIRHRGSARRFDPAAPVALRDLEWMLRVASAMPPWDGDDRAELHVVVHAVRGLEPGTYRWTPEGPLRTGSADRETSNALCLGQDLGRDAAALLFFAARLGGLSAREYRVAMLGAGIGLGRLYLAAAALGIGCTGLTYVDSLLPGSSIPYSGLAVAGIGYTDYRSRAGGTPGAAARLSRMPLPPSADPGSRFRVDIIRDIRHIPPDDFDALDTSAGAAGRYHRVQQWQLDGRWQLRYLRVVESDRLVAAVPLVTCRGNAWPDPRYCAVTDQLNRGLRDPAVTWGRKDVQRDLLRAAQISRIVASPVCDEATLPSRS